MSNKIQKNSQAFYNLGRIKFLFHDYDRAAFYFGESLKLDPKYSSSIEQMIHSLKMLGKDAQAETLFKDFEKLEPVIYKEMREFYGSHDWRDRLYHNDFNYYKKYPTD